MALPKANSRVPEDEKVVAPEATLSMEDLNEEAFVDLDGPAPEEMEEYHEQELQEGEDAPNDTDSNDTPEDTVDSSDFVAPEDSNDKYIEEEEESLRPVPMVPSDVKQRTSNSASNSNPVLDIVNTEEAVPEINLISHSFSPTLRASEQICVCNPMHILGDFITKELELGITLPYISMCLTDNVLGFLAETSSLTVDINSDFVLHVNLDNGKEYNIKTYKSEDGTCYGSLTNMSVNEDYLHSVMDDFAAALFSGQDFVYELIGSRFFSMDGTPSFMHTLRLNEYEIASLFAFVNSIIEPNNLPCQIDKDGDKIVLRYAK